ncbi:CDGSH iron-sulfur domain-containing protein [Bradyrhizobium sp. HKCCYLS2038]|uniref:CDGSH iron-sulfur domain-containing protein n=1 Tax=unclassified Bradyrhizobium TaxID=2631580 RepID=UPI003EB930ED
MARNCPSGAITFAAVDSQLDEVDPPVNTIRLRQVGPYAVNARIQIDGHVTSDPVRRRTLCRCGASANKPFCDGSHARSVSPRRASRTPKATARSTRVTAH